MTESTESTNRQLPAADVSLTPNELNALLLRDLEGQVRQKAAHEMQVSTSSYDRILKSAHHKIAEALCRGTSITATPGEHELSGLRTFKCDYCGRIWQLPRRAEIPSRCPRCHGEWFQIVS